MLIRRLVVLIAAVFCAGTLGAQDFNAVRAVALERHIIDRRSGETVTLNFGLQPLVHGPYIVEIGDVFASDVTVTLNGTELGRPGDMWSLVTPREVKLNPANTLQVRFRDSRFDSSVTVAIYGWRYEFADVYPDRPAFIPVPPPDNNATGPDTTPGGSVDWRTKGTVTPVKNQGSCDDSWAFSTTGAIEGDLQIKTGRLASLSEQQLLDCSGERSCSSGDTKRALQYVMDKGLEPEASYPYTARVGSCRAIGTPPYQISGFTRLAAGNEAALLAAVAQQPVSVVIDANWFSSYTRGVVNPDCDAKSPQFESVLVVGYGYDSTSGYDYWLVKNSLGSSWGESGYFRIVRGVNACGIADYAMVPN